MNFTTKYSLLVFDVCGKLELICNCKLETPRPKTVMCHSRVKTLLKGRLPKSLTQTSTKIFFFIFSRSSLIYDARNNQKKIEFPEITEVSNFSCQESELSVLWKDGHTSTYNLLDLENNFKQKDLSSNIKGHCFSDITIL